MGSHLGEGVLEAGGGDGGGSHVLLLPYPSQGHIHPMLQFGKRLAFHGLRPTLAVTRFILATCAPDAAALGSAVRVAAISDGFDRGGFGECSDVTAYLARLEAAGSETLSELLRDEAARGRPVRAVVYDAFLPWAQGVARRHGAAAAAFFTQPCAVNVAYGHVWCNRVRVPVEAGTAEVWLPGLPALEPEGLPWFLRVGPGPYPAYFEMVMSQFQGLEQADDVLVNSFYELESEEAAYMESAWRAKTIGPTVPASYLGDDRLPSDTRYGFHLYELTTAPCIAWLDTHPPRSVVYASFGSLSDLDPAEMREVAHGLLDARRPFLWVVRSSESHKLPAGYEEACGQRGLVVSWCPQLEVLAHRAVGCFLTHCGWNSTVEALVTGVPMVAVPQWTDQPMNAKYVEAVWRAGVRVRPAAEDGLVRSGEVVRGIHEVMDGEKSDWYRRNGAVWMEKARAASREGGSSDRNIAEFVAKYVRLQRKVK
ncbi:UDP-glucosyltransferase UGT13248-like [Phragmites australis]|uniref:UDP-glucosyltransferase UGT13248-like n=1 Tax=Phragmites australis TaxID=29695 RepID=UPI002D788E96|nr:UDP-glucosyltransferase UGT13248-like [Phragmites australis]